MLFVSLLLMEDYADKIASLLVSAYEIHEIVIAETGGIIGLRDAAMLHAAVARPFATFDGQELYPSDFEKAAALFHSLIKSHPFMDGTKRTAFTTALFFLADGGYGIPDSLPRAEVIRVCLSVAEENLRQGRGEKAESFSTTALASWFESLLRID